MLLAAIYLALMALFHFLGNTSDVPMFGRSLFNWMIVRWSDATISIADYSHGWLIPLVSLAALWPVRRSIAVARKSVNHWGLLLVIAGLLLHWAGARMQQPRISLVSIIVLIWSVPLYLYGMGVARHLLFPCGYLVFCIPLNFLDTWAFGLRMFSTVTSVGLLNGLGIASERVGTAIRSSAGKGFMFDVADPCSGLRSLLAITALVIAYAWFSQEELWKRAVLCVSSVLFAIAGNVARILSIAIVACSFGQDAAMKMYHDYSGFIIFFIVVLLMVVASNMLSHIDRHFKRRRGGTERSQKRNASSPC